MPTEDSEIVDKLELSFYVDSYVAGMIDIRQQGQFILKVKEILSRRCFIL